MFLIHEELFGLCLDPLIQFLFSPINSSFNLSMLLKCSIESKTSFLLHLLPPLFFFVNKDLLIK